MDIISVGWQIYPLIALVMSILKRINLPTDGHDQMRVNYVHRLVNLSSSGYAMQQCLLQTSQQVYYLHGYIIRPQCCRAAL